MCALLATVTWLCLCSLLWKAEATYDSSYFVPAPIFKTFHPAQPFCPPSPTIPYSVVAHFDMNGIRGNVTFSQRDRNKPVSIVGVFDGLDQFDEDERWGWHVHDCPINFAQLDEFPCSTASVGGHFDPDNRGANVNYTADCSENPDNCELGDLSGRFGRLTPDKSVYQFTHQERGFNLYGPHTFVGRSVVIHRTDGFRWACANIEYDGHNRLDTFVARFPKNPKQQQNTLQGDVVLRRSTKRAGISISGVLYRVDGGPVSTSHNWYLKPGTCDTLDDGVFGRPADPRKAHHRCSTARHRRCILGDLAGKCGQLESDADGRIKFFCTDAQLGLQPFEPDNTDPDYPRYSLIVEEEAESGGTVLSCSCFEAIAPKVARAMIQRIEWVELPNGRFDLINEVVDFYVYQSDPHDPTYIRLYTNQLPEVAEGEPNNYIQIRERPVGADKNCSNLGPVFESRPYFDEAIPDINGVIRTGEKDFIGELRNKIPLTRYGQAARTSWLPLFGRHSIIGRSLVLHDGSGRVVNCATIVEQAPTVDLRQSLSGYFKK